MDDAPLVSGIQGVGELDANLHGAIDRQRAGGQNFIEGITDEELHSDEGAALVLFDGVDGADCGMVKSGGGAGFPKKAFEGLRVALVRFRNEFEGNAAAEPGVFGFIDDTHAAGAEFSEDPIVGDGFVDHDFGCKVDVRRSENFGQCAESWVVS